MLDYTKMPTRITDQRKQQDIDNDLRFAVRQVQDAITALRSLQGFTIPATACIDEWTNAVAAAREKKERALQAISDDPTLQEEEKAAKVKKWKTWLKQVAMYSSSITSAIHARPELKWTYDEATATIVPTADIFALACDAATVDVPDEASDHAMLICFARDAVNALRKWEREHNVAKVRLEVLLNLEEDELAERWATGSIFYDDTFATPQVLAARQFKENQIL
ncbi:MAG: hypothetical protein IJ243_02515 [Prevotella sp.]|nr:hypothetical protein [Prevotella sp.]